MFGILETRGKVVVKVTLCVTKKNAKQLIDQYVSGGSTMVTDGYVMYSYLKNESTFTHVVVDHSYGEYVKEGFHTNGIENFWSLFKERDYRNISSGIA